MIGIRGVLAESLLVNLWRYITSTGRTSCIDWPKISTMLWSAIILGFLRSRSPRVIWKRERARIMDAADMRPMVAIAEESESMFWSVEEKISTENCEVWFTFDV